jgi:hypothetical protein
MGLDSHWCGTFLTGRCDDVRRQPCHGPTPQLLDQSNSREHTRRILQHMIKATPGLYIDIAWTLTWCGRPSALGLADHRFPLICVALAASCVMLRSTSSAMTGVFSGAVYCSATLDMSAAGTGNSLYPSATRLKCHPPLLPTSYLTGKA